MLQLRNLLAGLAMAAFSVDSGLFYRVSGVNYFFSLTTTISPYRVDSRLLLPARSRCLMNMLPVEFRHDGQQKREATEFGNQTRTDPGDCGAVSRHRAAGEEGDP